MDYEYLIRGIIFLIIGVLILLYEFKDRGIKQDGDSTFKFDGVAGAIIFLMLAVYYIWGELEKIV